MDKNLALEFVRATEEGAIAAARWFGKGDKISADKASVDAIRARFRDINISGKIIIGEGEKDKAPMLYTGEEVGAGGVEVDIAIDPLEGTSLVAEGKWNAISVLAAAPRGSLLSVPGSYMDQIAVGSECAGKIDITKSPYENINRIAEALDKDVSDVTIALMDRERHNDLIKSIRKAGARITLIEHGSIAAGIAAAIPDSGIDALFGIAGAPEGIILAAALKSLGGDMQGVLKPHNKYFVKQAKDMGFSDLDKVYNINDLAKGDRCMFAATGVSDGPFLKGVVFSTHKIKTHSVVMRQKSKTIRWIEAEHYC